MVRSRHAAFAASLLACLVAGPVGVATAETLIGVQDQIERRSAELAAARTAAESDGPDSRRDAEAAARRLERQKSRLVARESILAREAARAAEAAMVVEAAGTSSVASLPFTSASGGFATAELAGLTLSPSSLLPGVAGPARLGSHVFPIAGASTFSDDWGVPRPGGRRHEGIDLFAARGTPVVAVADGTLSRVGYSGISGNRLWLTDASGTAFFYAHLDAYSNAAQEGAFVRQGTVLGFTGDTGDAKGTPPHVHFEVHPGGGEPIQPFPIVSRWPRLGSASP